MKLVAILLTLVALGSSGCVYTVWEGPAEAGKTPARMTRISLFGNQSAARVDATSGTITAYSSQQIEAAAAIAEGVAAGLTKAAVKP